MSNAPKLGPNGAVIFADVSYAGEAIPAWMERVGRSNASPAIITLRPPPMGSADLEQVGSEQDFVASASKLDWMTELQSTLTDGQFESAPPSADDETPARRVDTMIDQLTPRVEAEALETIRNAVGDLIQLRQQAVQQSEDSVVQLVSAIARRVVGRELMTDPTVVCSLVSEGLSALVLGDQVTVRLGEFFGDLTSEIEALIAETGVRPEVIIDPKLGEYGCRIETQWGSVDESLEHRLATVLEGISIHPPPKER